MKKIIISLIFGLTFFALYTSCSLDIDPRTSIDPNTANAEDIESLLRGCYDAATFGGSQNKSLFFLSEDISADNLAVRADGWGTSDLDMNNISESNSNLLNWWNHSFVVIYRCNDFLSRISNYSESDFVSGRKKEMEAEARFIRAWMYYQLVAHWGAVPIITSVNDELVSRATEANVWIFILSELKNIENNLPDFSNASFASKSAADIMIARVSLILGDSATAASYSQLLIDDSSFALADDYSSIWKKDSKEIIMQWQATTKDPLSYGYFVNGTTGRYDLPIDQSLIDAFEAEPGDKRQSSSTHKMARDQGGFWYECAKYWITGLGDDPWPVARIAEAYLINAEALNYPKGLKSLNILRNKRGLGNCTATDQSSFDDAILNERRLELSCEGFRWTDLKRTKRTSEFCPNITGPDDKNLLYPIPQAALDANPNLKLNPN